MPLGIQFEAILTYAVGLVLLYLIGWLLLAPLKVILRFIYNGLIGGAILWAVGALGGIGGIVVPINAVTALVAGFFGVPGVVTLYIVQWIIG